jgi:hypothetical protein
LVLIADQNAWGDPFPIRFVVLPFVTSLCLSVGGYHWIRGPREHGANLTCKTCGFDLRGHAVQPKKCPECGEEPKASPRRSIPRSLMVAFPGIAAILLAVGCLLFALLYLGLWSSGTFYV